MLKLIDAREAQESKIREYKNAFSDSDIEGGAGLKHFDSIYEWQEELEENANLPEDSNDLVRATTYFLTDGEDLIGMIDIRHFLNEYLLNYGGNIGYSIRKDYREKGYAKKMLALAIEKCKQLGLEKILITCDDENIASSKVIESQGGILENTVENDTVGRVRRYWIKL